MKLMNIREQKFNQQNSFTFRLSIQDGVGVSNAGQRRSNW